MTDTRPDPETTAMNRPPHSLLLIDLDGTVLAPTGEIHVRAMLEAIESVTGPTAHVRLEDGYLSLGGSVYDGMVDGQLFRMALEHLGYDPNSIEALLPRIVSHMPRAYVRLAAEVRVEAHPLPGAETALARLARAGFALAAVTGNVEAVARHKCDEAGLSRLLTVGAFGDLAAHRVEVVERAIERAVRHFGMGFGPGQIAYVGDTPNDILAAQEAGIGSVAVCTGRWGPADLSGRGPDLLLESLMAPGAMDLLVALTTGEGNDRRGGSGGAGDIEQTG